VKNVFRKPFLEDPLITIKLSFVYGTYAQGSHQSRRWPSSSKKAFNVIGEGTPSLHHNDAKRTNIKDPEIIL
jgi:hypothetical protein